MGTGFLNGKFCVMYFYRNFGKMIVIQRRLERSSEASWRRYDLSRIWLGEMEEEL